MVRLVLPPGSGKQVEVLGSGAEAAPAVVGVLQRAGGALMAHAGLRRGADDELSQQAVAFAAGLGDGGRGGCHRCRRGLRAAPRGRRRSPTSSPSARRGRVVAAGTDRGNEVLAHVAAKLDLPMAANCIAVDAGDPATVTRVRWGGSLLEEARCTARRCCSRSRRTRSPPQPSPTRRPSRRRDAVSDATAPCASASASRPPSGGVSLADADVVVSGGRGVGSAEGFAVIEELAELLGGAVGCSRAVTSAGWRPHSDQVGQTGTKISPEIYIACGISGATQHMAGCKGAKRLLAINPDGEASIFASADYAVIGDLHEVVPAITAEIRKARGA